MEIYYAIERKMTVPDGMSDEEIEEMLSHMDTNNDIVWDKNPGLFYESN